jgi:hypothetical protein
VRGTGLFLVSPLDWALIESWKIAGVPLEAVLRGIDVAFEKWRKRKIKTQMVNSLAYCTQAVMAEARAMAGSAPRPAKKESAPPFAIEELRAYLSGNAEAVRPAFPEIAAALDRLTAEVEAHFGDLEQLEQRLSVLEEKMIASARGAQSEEELLEARRELERELRPYRGKMTAEQLTMLEKQWLERRVLENKGLPRLSLFYLR